MQMWLKEHQHILIWFVRIIVVCCTIVTILYLVTVNFYSLLSLVVPTNTKEIYETQRCGLLNNGCYRLLTRIVKPVIRLATLSKHKCSRKFVF